MYSDFTEMPVWKEALALAEDVFKLTAELPKKEDYGLTSQLRRAAVSISANIAEGYGRTGTADKNSFTITPVAQRMKQRVCYYTVQSLIISQPRR